ncbi:hypothetical protein TWF481_000113 [Arthrobotrys musiformis]|uniref:F-box domain-containing protein n=1 Tax=Arthrobotrys musiformis TaxID=47236 RepID=A0AAV9WLN4_9PEZI
MHMRLHRGSRTTASAKGKQPETQTTSSIFLIHEILEAILLDVPAIDLLLNCRGVCKTWKDLIETTSPDLRYYSFSGLRRPRAGSDEEKERPRTPDEILPSFEYGVPQDKTTKTTPVLTPIALEILAIFWKRLAKKAVKTSREKREDDDAESTHFFRAFYKAAHCGARSYDSSRESGFFYTTSMFVLFLCFVPIATPIYHVYDKVLRPIGPTHLKQRWYKRTSKNLIKEFQPIWEKVQIFYPRDPKTPLITIGGCTNWRSRDDWWDYDFQLDTTFQGLPEAALALMMPLVQAGYAYRPTKFDPTAYSRPTAFFGPKVVIDLKRQDGVNNIHRYADYSPREVIIFGGHRPYDVIRDFARPPEVGFARLSDKTIRG